jgi:hypothetical protein
MPSLNLDRPTNIQRGLAASLIMLIGIPATLLLLPRSPSAIAQQADTQQADTQQAEPLRTIADTQYEEQIIYQGVPVGDPAAGSLYRFQQDFLRLPNKTVPWARENASVAGGKVQQLLSAILQSKEDDPARNEKLQQLEALLEEDFNTMHEDQAAQIRETEQRLAKLKQVHQQRMENRETIVQRRIDQLLGQPDPLQWSPPPLMVPQWSRTYLPGQAAPAVIPGTRSSIVAAVPSSPTIAVFRTTPPDAIAPAPSEDANRVPGGEGVARSGPASSGAVGPSGLFRPIFELLQAEAELNSATTEVEQARHRKAVAIAKMQLDLTAAELNQEHDYKEAELAKAMERADRVKEQVNAGILPQAALEEPQAELRKAENELRLIELKWQQFNKALESLK